MTTRTLHLNAFLVGVGHHEAAWCHPDVEPERVVDIAHYQELAQQAEGLRGRMDGFLSALRVA